MALKKLKTPRNRAKKLKTPRKTKQYGGAMKRGFADLLFNNMWTFMNPDTLIYVLNNEAKCKINIKYKASIDDDDWSDDDYRKSIVFKGVPEDGHYVYIDHAGMVWGTYECNILYAGDDGICHGFALAAALKDCGYDVGDLSDRPRRKQDNYIIIMNVYKTLIENGWWDNALENYFYRDVNWLAHPQGNIRTQESLNALVGLNEYLAKAGAA